MLVRLILMNVFDYKNLMKNCNKVGIYNKLQKILKIIKFRLIYLIFKVILDKEY